MARWISVNWNLTSLKHGRNRRSNCHAWRTISQTSEGQSAGTAIVYLLSTTLSITSPNDWNRMQHVFHHLRNLAKWPKFSRQHFQMHFLERKDLQVDPRVNLQQQAAILCMYQMCGGVNINSIKTRTWLASVSTINWTLTIPGYGSNPRE